MPDPSSINLPISNEQVFKLAQQLPAKELGSVLSFSQNPDANRMIRF